MPWGVRPTLLGFSLKEKGASLLHWSEDRSLQESPVLAGSPIKLSADPKLYPAASPTWSANPWGRASNPRDLWARHPC